MQRPPPATWKMPVASRSASVTSAGARWPAQVGQPILVVDDLERRRARRPRRSIVSTKFLPVRAEQPGGAGDRVVRVGGGDRALAGELRAAVGRARAGRRRTRRRARSRRRGRRSRSRGGRCARRPPRRRARGCRRPSPLTSSATSSWSSAPSTSVKAAQLMTRRARRRRRRRVVNSGVDDVDRVDVALDHRRGRPRARRRTTSWPSIPYAPTTSSFTRRCRCRSCRRPGSGRRAAGRASGRSSTSRPSSEDSIRASRSRTLEPSSMIECSTSARSIDAALADRRVGADVGVDEPGARADDRGAAHAASARARAPASITTRPSTVRVGQLAVDAALDRVEHQPVGLEHVLEAAGVLPPALHDVRLDAAALVDEVLDRVGDLELAARRGLDRARGVVDAGGEHVDADEREVGLRLGRLLLPGA